MTTRTKWFGIIFAILHIFFTGIFDFYFCLFSSASKYEVIAALITVPELIVEFPIWFSKYILRNAFNIDIPTTITSSKYLIFTYIFGSIFYFFIGVFVSWLFQSAKAKKDKGSPI